MSGEKMPQGNAKTKRAKVDTYEVVMPLLEAMYEEFAGAAKKKPDAVLSARKVDIVNRLLTDVLTVLSDEPTRSYLDLFDKDDLPRNDDVVLMLGQIVTAMKSYHEKYYRKANGYDWDWVI